MTVHSHLGVCVLFEQDNVTCKLSIQTSLLSFIKHISIELILASKFTDQQSEHRKHTSADRYCSYLT